MKQQYKQLKKNLKSQGYTIIEPSPTLAEAIKQTWLIKFIMGCCK